LCVRCQRGWFDLGEQPAALRIVERFVAAGGAEKRTCPACGAHALVLGSVGNLGLERCGSCGGVRVRVQEAPRWRSILGWTGASPLGGGAGIEAVFSWLDWLVYRARRSTQWPPRVPWESNLSMEEPFEQSVLRGDVEGVRRALEAGADVDARNAMGQSALMLAAHRGDLAMVELLLARRADPDQKAKYGLSALMLAVVGGHGEVARALAAAGADLRLRGSGAPGFADKTAADLAAERGMQELAERLRPREG